MSAAGGGGDNERGEEREDVVLGPGPSKKKRLVSYNKQWEEKHSWVKPSWPAITAYFRSLGEACPVVLRKIFSDDDEDKAATVEIYLCFFQNVGVVFDQLVKKLEETNLCITDVYEEIRKFKAKIQQRKDDGFCGFQTRQLMDKLLPAEKAKVKVDFTKFYSTVISYIEKWFNSMNSLLFILRVLGGLTPKNIFEP
ncbi:Mu-theraphotoxin-Hhn1b 3 [Dissostichus eleginoides]|uniref:Mu-theraphotoxin-Hhn1b 3 n=1 Tax=Dissostichus eleginoides TaxID=100907 RepID=A0AAD9F4P4_DISEL|nr:Mu-theraphotoxin-Hhn1b 3 [Dissostichus eleginoides]